MKKYFDFEITRDQFKKQRDDVKSCTEVEDLKKGVPYLVFWEDRQLERDIGDDKFHDSKVSYHYYLAIFTLSFIGDRSFMNKVSFVNPELKAKHTSVTFTMDSYGGRWVARRVI